MEWHGWAENQIPSWISWRWTKLAKLYYDLIISRLCLVLINNVLLNLLYVRIYTMICSGLHRENIWQHWIFSRWGVRWFLYYWYPGGLWGGGREEGGGVLYCHASLEIHAQKLVPEENEEEKKKKKKRCFFSRSSWKPIDRRRTKIQSSEILQPR